MGSHTIILLQARDTRTGMFLEGNTTRKATEALCREFEEKVKELNPTIPEITYELDDLYAYLKKMKVVSALVYDAATRAYIPYNRDWVENQVYKLLSSQS